MLGPIYAQKTRGGCFSKLSFEGQKLAFIETLNSPCLYRLSFMARADN